MSVMTTVCGVWSLSQIFNVIRGGGIGKNGSTVAVSLIFNIKTDNWMTKTQSFSINIFIIN